MKRIIPDTSPVAKQLKSVLVDTQVIIISGLPGVGKSLYVQEIQNMAQEDCLDFDIIQWDIARKSFETESILAKYPMGEGTVHNGLKLCAGLWLMDTLTKWLEEYQDSNRKLIIEAPLVGNRFVELVQKNSNEKLEAYLSSKAVKVIMPIPSKKVRKLIEDARAEQVKEDAKSWMGAKPSVIQMLWDMTCDLAVELGLEMDNTKPVPYDPKVYIYVFEQILKHRNFIPLNIDEVFEVPKQSEDELHNLDSMKATFDEADVFGEEVFRKYSSDEEINTIVDNWYLT